MSAYSKDLKLKVLAAVDRGVPRREVVGAFGVSLAALKRWLKRRSEGEDLAPRPSPGRTPSILATEEERRALWALARSQRRRHPGAPPRAVGAGARREGVGGDDEPGGEEAGLDLQKKSLAASERDEGKRSAGRERLRGVDPRRLVFVDGCSTNVAFTPRYARAPKGERARGRAPRNWGKNVTLISSISLGGVGPSLSIEGSSDGESFGLYLRELLCPALKRGQIVVMDNLSVHKGAWVRELIEERGAEVRYLPPYSPDLKWDEKAEMAPRRLR